MNTMEVETKEELILPELAQEHCEQSVMIKMEPHELMENNDESESNFHYRCFVCNLDTASQQELFDHYESSHSEQMEHISNVGNEHEMKIEDNTLVGDEAPNSILYNGKDQQIEQAFDESEGASGHEWLFNCSVCGFASTDKLDVLHHMEDHIDVQPLSCKECMYIFSNQYSLKNYKAKSLHDKPHVCCHCPFRSHALQKLKDHCFYHHHFENPESETSAPPVPITVPTVSLKRPDGNQPSPVVKPPGNFRSLISPTSTSSEIANSPPMNGSISKMTKSDTSGTELTDPKNVFLVLKDCQSNGQNLGDIKIPAHYILPHIFNTSQCGSESETLSPVPQISAPAGHPIRPQIVEKLATVQSPSPQLCKISVSDLLEANSSSNDSLTQSEVDNDRNLRKTPNAAVAVDKKNSSTSRRSRSIPCPICSHLARDTWNLKTHMLTHTKEKPFACTLCSYRASQAAHVRKHMIVHYKGRERTKYR